MRKTIWTILSMLMIFSSCIEEFELPKDDTPKVEPVPTLSISQKLIGSYSAQFDCEISEVERVFIRGGFHYGKDASLADGRYMPGIITGNHLSVIVTDVEPNSTYYFKAVISDDNGEVESSIARFATTVFKVEDSDYHVGYKGGEVSISAESTLDLKYSVADADWIKQISGNRFEVLENDTFYDRVASIVITTEDGIFKSTVSVGQDQGPLHFASESFGKIIVSEYDKNGSGELELAEFEGVTAIKVCTDDVDNIDEIKFFPELVSLSVAGSASGKGQLKTVDLSANSKLKELDLSNNGLASLDITGLSNLASLDVSSNALTSLDLSRNPLLEQLDVEGNQLSTLDLDKTHALVVVNCSHNGLEKLSGLEISTLQSLECDGNKLSELDVTGARALTQLSCSGNGISELDLMNCPSLERLDCSSNKLKILYTRKNVPLSFLDCHSNEIEVLDVRYNEVLTSLDCHDNRLKQLDMTRSTVMEHLDCSMNQIESLDVENCRSLKDLNVSSNPLKILIIGNAQKIEGVTVGRNTSHVPEMTSIRSHEDLVTVPDKEFKSYLVSHFDIDKDGEISVDEGLYIKSISVSTDAISSLEGIECFKNLQYLKCYGSTDEFGHTSGKLASLDVSQNVSLTQLICDGNSLKSLDVSKNTLLRTLWCRNNRLTSLELSTNTDLEDLNCEGNQIVKLDLANNKSITSLDCSPMDDESGKNCLEVVNLSIGTRIEYVNGNNQRRSISNIPESTIITFGSKDLSGLPSRQ